MSATNRPDQLELRRAYEECRRITRREAKNFYYGFLPLPQHKRDAMCAMYAFMRRADDIADDESMPIAERRELLARWLSAFHERVSLSPSDAAVFTAVRDTQQRFGVSDQLLSELVAGTAMDLEPEPPAGVARVEYGGRSFDVYTTIEALDRYCYLVASVVGLVTIRIFGYGSPESEQHAVKLGLAFQYTNILRDVREDAERNRIYLPLQTLERHGATLEQVVKASREGQAAPALVAAMVDLAARAENMYAAREPLLADLQRDSRGAMWTLIGIYHALLVRVRRAKFQVFRERVRVPTSHKLLLLARGLLMRVGL